MFLYHLKFALRNFARQKVFSIINILGLTIGLTGCLLAFLFVQDELKIDKHFSSTSNVYQLKGNNFSGVDISPTQPGRLLPYLLENVPDIESGNRINQQTVNVGYNNKYYNEENFMYSDSNFFRFFGWELLVGNPDNVLDGPNKLVISAGKAKQLFGNENPVGKTLLIDLNHTFTITGICKDFPNQSTIKANFIASFSSFKIINPYVLQGWGNFSSLMFLKLKQKTIPDKITPKLSKLWNDNPSNDCCGARNANVKMYLQPFGTLYYQELTMSGYRPTGNLYIAGFSIIAGILLIIALFNFINLSIAQITGRFTEAGIKKVIGANFANFCQQLFVETSLYVGAAIILSHLVLIDLLPPINSFAHKELQYSLLHNSSFLYFNMAILAFTLLSCSIYPSVYFAKVQPVAAIKAGKQGLLSKLGSRSHFWDVMVITQFALAIVLIVFSLLMNKQLFFIRTTSPGFERENIISIQNGWKKGMDKRYELFREKVKTFPEVSLVSSGINVPTTYINNWGAPQLKDGSRKMVTNCGFLSVDYDYFKVLGCRFAEGRDFDRTLRTDEDKCIISETFKRQLGEKTPVGLILDNLWDGKKREIIGVVKDINFTTFHNEVKPEIFFLHHQGLPSTPYILVKFKTAHTKALLSKFEKLWQDLAPQEPFTYFFTDEKYESNYRKEINTAKIINVLTAIAIFLCCLGLFGLALFVVNNRIKEIGIRKTNGATSLQILTWINMPFIQWISVAYIIACPVAYILVQQWLEDFAYKTDISAWIFVFAAFITILVTFVTVSYHSWRASVRNPVECLRYE